MASQQERAELDARARQGETVVPGGTGGKSLEAQEHLAEGSVAKAISSLLALVFSSSSSSRSSSSSISSSSPADSFFDLYFSVLHG